MKRYKKNTIIENFIRFLLCTVVIGLVWQGSLIVSIAADVAADMAVYPGVTFSPDGTAWTTDYMDRTNESLPKGYTILTGQTSALRELNAGEHYYQKAAEGSIKIGKWVVGWQKAQCIHYYGAGNYNGFQAEEGICEHYYNNGWNAYCADCNELVTELFFYAKSNTIKGILTMPAQSYYLYLCPHCHGLEQGAEYHHMCKAISYNYYKIRYEANAPEEASVQGYMAVTKHMYNNAAIYEGVSADKLGYTDTKLRRNTYACEGYGFLGWNTQPDGSGEWFTDGQSVRNLSEEEGAEVPLYAQWKQASSTLAIDANGGSYLGEELFLVTQQSQTTYRLEEKNLIPAPGYRVSFEANGGSLVDDILTSKQFSRWEPQGEFCGEFRESVYTFPMLEGNEDTVKVQYLDVPFALPDSKKENEILVGWYKDEACRDEAFIGVPGDTVSVSEDTVFYAKWARLTLWAYDDYESHGGVGAVDLKWEQKDGQGKYYKLYQSLDKVDWDVIYAGEKEQEGTKVLEQFGIDKQGQQYVIEHTGYYKITAAGAKGEDYDATYLGGNGGSVTAEYWLQKGDILTFFAGASGKDMEGGNNGSKAAGGDALSEVGRGGGAGTEIYITRDGEQVPLLIAGGGAGACEGNSGGDGGSVWTEVDTMAGEDAYAGNGGGAQGGSSDGTFLRTTLDAPAYEDIAFKSEWSSAFPSATQVYYKWKKPQSSSSYPTYTIDSVMKGEYMTTPQIMVGGLSREVNIYGADASQGEYHYGDTIVNKPEENIPLSYNCYQTDGGFVRKYVAEYPVKGNTNVVVSGLLDAWGDRTIYGSIRFRIINTENEEVLHDETYVDGSAGVSSSDYTAAWSVGAWGDFDVEGVENVRVEVWIYVSTYSAHVCTKVMDTFFYGREVAEVVQASGGSSYINTSFGCRNEGGAAGTNAGDGYAQVEGVQIGFVEETQLDNVLAKDEEAPGMVQNYEVGLVDENVLMVTLSSPEDYGTLYYHMAESYRFQDNILEKAATSNITANTLTSGVAGYYYYVDEEPEGVATQNHDRTIAEKIPVVMSADILYLHVAAVDIAGNLGNTIHVELKRDQQYPTDDSYPENRGVYTKQLIVEDTEFVYRVEEETYFVKADGATEHILYATAGLDGAATMDFQVDSLRLKAANEAHFEWVQTTVPHGNLAKNTQDFPSDELSMEKSEGETHLFRTEHVLAKRTSHAMELEVGQNFTVDSETESFWVYPQAIAELKQKQYWSIEEEDIQNAVQIIPDAEAPVITGLDELQDLDVLDMTEQSMQVELWAEDALSGLQEFYVIIHNRDNHMKAEYVCDEAGMIEVEINKGNPLFLGDISVSAIAVDRVSNANVVGEDGLTFTLETSLYRERNREEYVFKTGDGAVLEIFTSGYVERVEVEFPEEFLEVNPDLNYIFEYETPTLRKQESLQFHIPLGILEQEYEVTVKAYKKGQMLISKPTLVVVEGTVLAELRTRIRNNG